MKETLGIDEPIQNVLQLAGRLRTSGRLDETVELLKAAQEHRPDNGELCNDLGLTYFMKGETVQAIAQIERATQLPFPTPFYFSNLAYCLKHTGQFEQSRAVYQKGMFYFPHDAQLYWHCALLLLSLGQWEAGWTGYDYRWDVPGFPSKKRNFPQPQWEGQNDFRETLLIHAEQGFGDTIQFIRYVHLAARHFQQIILEVQPELFALIEYQLKVGTSLLPGNLILRPTPGEHPEAHWQIPLLSLPRVLNRKDLRDPPLRSAYLAAPKGINVGRTAEGWPRLAVGVLWQGRPTHGQDVWRSFRPTDCTPLWDVPGIQWFCLQKGIAAEQLGAWGTPIFNLGDRLDNFLATAQFIRGLDLVITPDTSVAHLSAALGVPTWMAVQKIADWRWGYEGETHPMYECLTLFRQTVRGQWQDVFVRMADKLAHWPV